MSVAWLLSPRHERMRRFWHTVNKELSSYLARILQSGSRGADVDEGACLYLKRTCAVLSIACDAIA